MAYSIEKKLVIAVSSSALFNLEESDSIFKTLGEEAYRQYQEKNINVPFDKGVAYPFIKRMLSLNNAFPEEQLVEIILFSRNSPETGQRAFRTIKHYGLNISRACFSSGNSNFQYLPSFNTSLFLSANPEDTKAANDAGFAAGTVYNNGVIDDDQDTELRLAFDFDGVLAGDESEKLFKESNSLEEYLSHEQEHASEPLSLGPIGHLLQQISSFQKLEKERHSNDPSYKRVLKTAIITARNAPAHERVITTLKHWGLEVDDAFFMGGIEKSCVLNVMKPHIFFDDQKLHFKNLSNIPAVHIPFGIANK